MGGGRVLRCSRADATYMKVRWRRTLSCRGAPRGLHSFCPTATLPLLFFLGPPINYSFSVNSRKKKLQFFRKLPSRSDAFYIISSRFFNRQLFSRVYEFSPNYIKYSKQNYRFFQIFHFSRHLRCVSFRQIESRSISLA